VKESLETILFLYLTRIHAAFALWTSNRMDSNNQNKTRRNPRKKANAGTGITTHPKANANPSGQNRKASEMNPSRQLWKFSDRVIPPFLILFNIIFRLVLELENDPFHMAMQMTPNVQSSGTAAERDVEKQNDKQTP
jgi:hypothetical protein